jgi:DNA-binding CsgD family transcriptional regulator
MIMHSTKLSSYHKLMDHAVRNCNRLQPDAEKLLKSLGFDGISLLAQAPLFYIVDYSQNKYLYIDPSCKTVFDHCVDSLSKAGPLYLSELWNKNDLAIFNDKILPEALGFLKKYPSSDHPDFSFSFNYRICTHEGRKRTILQRTTYITSPENKAPLAAIVFLTDISQYKEDSRIIHTVEKMHRDGNTLAIQPLLKTIYYPDTVTNVLSRREIEILRLVHEGMSSKKIADLLYLSVNTINNHRKHMLEKTHTKNTSELLGFALKHGFLL